MLKKFAIWDDVYGEKRECEFYRSYDFVAFDACAPETGGKGPSGLADEGLIYSKMQVNLNLNFKIKYKVFKYINMILCFYVSIIDQIYNFYTFFILINNKYFNINK